MYTGCRKLIEGRSMSSSSTEQRYSSKMKEKPYGKFTNNQICSSNSITMLKYVFTFLLLMPFYFS